MKRIPASSIDYRIIRRPRRQRASIVIRPDNRIEVLAPPRMPAAMIADFVERKRDWIERKLRYNREVRAPYIARTFTPGELFPLLGRNYALQLQRGRRAVRRDGDALIVSRPDAADANALHRQITAWYREQALSHVTARSRELAPRIGRQPVSVGVKAYKSRWGSCHHDGRIYFNWRLIMAPPFVVDHVVSHELCHLIHHNHSPAFHALLRAVDPAHDAANVWLKANGLALAL